MLRERGPLMQTRAQSPRSPLPVMNLEHEPGFGFRIVADDGMDPYVKIFESTYQRFGLAFEIDLFQDQLSFTLMPEIPEFGIEGAEDILELSDQCDRLQQWLDDCAESLIWTQSLFNTPMEKASAATEAMNIRK